MNFASQIAQEAKRFSVAKLTRATEFAETAKCLVSNKDRYLKVANMTGVPWFIIAVIHQREASGSWECSIAQGDRWDRKSVNVPKNRGPFKSWEAAALDALIYCPPKAASWKDWSCGGALCLLTQYNGEGYFDLGVIDPYIWAGTDLYHSGKFTSDGHYDPHAVDEELGCAGLIMAMADIDPTIPQTFPWTASSSNSLAPTKLVDGSAQQSQPDLRPSLPATPNSNSTSTPARRTRLPLRRRVSQSVSGRTSPKPSASNTFFSELFKDLNL